MKITLILTVFAVLLASTLAGEMPQGGIGVKMMIAYRDDERQIAIAGVAQGTPAARAGLNAGQVIRAIDGVPTYSLKLTDCVARIRGPIGTKVALLIHDRSENTTNSVELTRAVSAAEALEFPRSAGDDCDELGFSLAGRFKSVSVTTNHVVRIAGTNGARALIHFTDLGRTNAHYRWRFRAAGAASVTSGTGVTFEDYERRIDAYGVHHLTRRGSPDAAVVKVGDIRLSWSYGSRTNAWLTYFPSRESAEILDASTFDSEP